MKRVRRLVARGFTLIEMVVVVVVLGIVSIAVVTMVAQVGAGQDDNSDLQVGTQLLQECGEWIVSNHRRDENFFTATLASSANCFGLTTYGGFTAPNVTVTAYTGAGCPTVPSSATCKRAAVTLTKGSSTLNTLNIVLVRYNPL